MNASNLYLKAFRTVREVQSNSRAQTLYQFVTLYAFEVIIKKIPL